MGLCKNGNRIIERPKSCNCENFEKKQNYVLNGEQP